MLYEQPQGSQQLLPSQQVSFSPHPRPGPILQIAAIRGSIGRAAHWVPWFILEVLPLDNPPRHGTDHNSKPLLPSSGIRVPPRPLRSRQEIDRSGDTAPPRNRSHLLGLPPAGPRLRP